ncbi:magnesium transporter [Mariniplasma anaerobium]|uniref:Magnesium transporter MgtE n=1 Tax=Mariniplasma anaerobium TaxID=2735436 RepID=A0A7U9TM45_9MOLU|nr:magnesium transporter [Mariniplasma anaerobium]BCR35523.1 magnesium transporter MgtE [Mariniplasma anaerobium]
MAKRINFKNSDALLDKMFDAIHAYDLSVLYPSLDDIEKRRMTTLISNEKFRDMFVELDHDDQVEVINLLPEPRQKVIFKNLESDDLKEFIEQLDQETQKNYLNKLTKVKAKTIELLLQYEEDSAASMMSTDFISLDKDTSIKEATYRVIRDSKESEFIDTIFVTDEDQKLIGKIDIKDLIIAREDQKMEQIMKQDFQFVNENDSIEKAIDKIQDYDKNAIAVLDVNKHIIGIITADDIFDELIEDYDDDYQRYALIQDHQSSYTSIQRSKQRLPWLFIAVILNLVTVSLLSLFANTLETVTVLVLFQPMILGMAGNIGTQSLAVTILGISKDTFDKKAKVKAHIIKELSVGILNSLILSILAFIFVFTLLTVIHSNQQQPIEIAQIVFIAIFSSMTVSAMMGTLVPLALNKFKIDPASASGPLMTTMNDILALMIYFGVATIAFL